MTVMWAKYRGPGEVTFAAPHAQVSRWQGVHDGQLQRAGRVHAAGGRGRRFGRIGRQLRLSLLLDQHAADDHVGAGSRIDAAPIASRTAVTFTKDVAPIFQAKCSLPSRRHRRADVAHHVRGSAALGAIDSAARGQPRDAAVASRQDGRHPRLQERSSLTDDEIATDREVGRRRRAAGQPGRHAAAADFSRRTSGTSASRTSS